MERSTMFLSEMTIVDHAYIETTGTVIGGSWNPSFLVSGKIDPVEKVVVDFSTIKKQVKSYIDDDNVGFDHKLWVIDGFSGVTKYEVDGKECTFDRLMDPDFICPNTPVTITTPVNAITAPKNAFKFIKATEGQEYNTETAGLWMAEYLNEIFACKNPMIDCALAHNNLDQDIEVVCKNTINVHAYADPTYSPVHYFTYTHGLKDSTSWGCQNLGHGHLSFIQIETAEPQIQTNNITFKIGEALNNTTFINRENVVMDNDEFVTIEYRSGRGRFAATYQKSDNLNKLVILDTETTIEFLVDYIKETFADELKSISATGIYVSEGLSKGAYIDL